MASEIGDFLRAKREQLTPQECGLPVFGQRRVTGLRREEVALLAGVSPDYYVRLEQGRARAASAQVLDAVARVLRLDAVETEHLHVLAHPAPSTTPHSTPARAGVLALLDAMTDVPAFVLSPCMDVVATNLLGEAVLGLPDDPAMRNTARQAFLDPLARGYYPEWEQVVRETTAHLRRMAGLHPDHPGIRSLVGELSIRSPEFVRLWSRHEVAAKTFGVKLLQHPEVGRLEFDYETLTLPGDPDQMLVTYTPSDDSTRDALVALGSLHAAARVRAPRAESIAGPRQASAEQPSARHREGPAS